ncbi:MAG: hypothetical protein E7296_00585 [Lachnospiraceae bacterium]|jgi:hypothetical protein|nr:hypothetical protein [Lachnospiraceae bacterium]
MKYYVDAAARCDGDGSEARPFKRINEAAKIAVAGDEVLVKPGLYREYVNPVNGGTKENRIVYKSVEPLGAVISGAEEVKNWKKYKGDVWVTRVDNGVFNGYNPYTTLVYGDWYFAKTERHTGCVYLNDKALYEATSLEDCLKPEVYTPSWEQEWTKYKWFALQEGNETVIYANFQGKDPRKEKVEINVRRECFMPEKEHVNFITFSGFFVEKAATTWAPPAAYQDGMVGPHWAYGWIIEDCEIVNSKCCGISLGKYYDPENDHYFTNHHIKGPTQMERDAVCRGQYHGWIKGKIGNHIIRRCNIHHCQQTGIVGRMGCVFSTIEDNHIHHINNMMELGGAEISGIKLHAAIDVLIRRNHIHNCTMGIWLDWEAQGARVTQNLLHDNDMPKGSTKLEGGMESQDIFVEVGHGPTLIDNNILLSRYGLRVATEGLGIIHNLILGSFTAVGDGVDSVIDGKSQRRYTPYHMRHRTEVMGFNTILHGDNRIYNNIFVQYYPVDNKEHKGSPYHQVVGTHVWDEYPTYDEWIKRFDMDVEKPDMMKLASGHFDHLPVWSEGNVYLNGAKAWKKEKNKLVDKKEKVSVELVESKAGYKLKTNIYDIIGDFADGIINTDMLGKVYNPEQRFEERDGSDIVFNVDYLGNHRGVSTIPGPFASKEELKEILY